MTTLDRMNQKGEYKRTVLVVENDDFMRSLIADFLESAAESTPPERIRPDAGAAMLYARPRRVIESRRSYRYAAQR